MLLHTVKIGNLTAVSVTEMPTSDTVFQEFLKINTHARTVDTRHSFLPSPFFVPGNEALAYFKKFVLQTNSAVYYYMQSDLLVWSLLNA